MITLDVGGQQVQVEDSFAKLDAAQQNAVVAKIADSLGIKAQPEAENSLAGSAKAVGSGLVSGAASLLGAPAYIAALVSDKAKPLQESYGSQAITKGIESNITGPLYQPQTGLEKTLRGVSEFAPGMLFPAGGAASGIAGNVARRLAVNVAAPGLASEAAGAISDDNPIAKVGAALLGAGSASKLGRMADLAVAKKSLPPVPTSEQIEASVPGLFNTPALKEARLSAPEVQSGLKTISDDLKSQYFDATPGTPTGSVYKVLESNAPLNGVEFSFQDLHNIRKRLGEISAGPDKSARTAAGHSISYLDELMQHLAKTAVTKGDAPQAANDLKLAIETAAANFRSQRVKQFLNDAIIKNESRHSGGNLENYIYQEVAKAKLRPDKYLKGWNGQEKEELFSIMPGPIAKANRRASKLLGGGGGLGQLVAGIGGTSLFGPVGGFALPAVGMGLRKAGDVAAQRKLEKVAELVRARTPSYSKHYADYLRTLEKKGLLDGLPPNTQLALQALIASRPNSPQ